MKNLKLHKSTLTRVDQVKDAKSVLIIKDGEFCYVTGQTIWRFDINNQPRLVTDLSTTGIYSDLNIEIICYTYFAWDSFIVCCSNGDVLLVQEDHVEVTYTFEEEVPVDISCSPDFERIILLTNRGKIILLNECFEVLVDFTLTEENDAAQTLVNVGWGKKETQFHGSEGKNKRITKEVIGDGDDGDDSINICWRSDGLFFAIGYFNKVTNLRSIKIFKRDGVLQNISEPLSGVQAILEWKTTNELMSFPQHINEKYFISFMEKNGLKHGEFIIPSTIIVKQLLWNHDSSILCIQCIDSIEPDKNYLLFLFCTNYTWQIKKWMTIDHKVLIAKWLDNSLQFITNNGIYYSLYWTEMLCTSSPGTLDWVAVIDYCSVLLTPFKQVIIPPPMFDLKLTLDFPVDSVLFLPDNQKNSHHFCFFQFNNVNIINSIGNHYYALYQHFNQKMI